MNLPPLTDTVQPRILRSYTTLDQIRADWGGSLILSVGLDARGAALATAANITGAVSLSIDNNPVSLREIVRTGAVDFVVNSVDEAIRAMKNEVRKQSPLSVALNADPILTVEEAFRRGLARSFLSVFFRKIPLLSRRGCDNLARSWFTSVKINLRRISGMPPRSKDSKCSNIVKTEDV